ncbi:hypothetical protein [Pseudomonas sp. 2FE]|uniref:hypothetical protein n=1 Tax=Pseudomonas sp. 2FE TaxID=2502190 RepID=UPI0010FA47E0|nr:hypothetical protein [Pseudomonas sp. 2FE]
MKTFESCSKAFHAAEAAIVAHRCSELGIEVQGKTMLKKLSMFLDLDNWPESPDLRGLTKEDEQDLRVWGADYSTRLQDFHRKAEELRTERHNALCSALRSLGKEIGCEFLELCGPLDQRFADALCKADRLRKTMLDGIGYVDLIDPETNFAKGFYGATALKKTELFHNLKLCAEYRNNGTRHSDEVMAKLGFAEEVCNEDR